MMATPIIIGIDTGGTFTDLVAIVGAHLKVHKVPSTPDDPARAVIDGLKVILEDIPGGATRSLIPDLVTYSSTVATNALLERKGARVLLVTNAGFEDLIEIGRQNRSDLYSLAPQRPEPLVARAMRLGVAERTYFDGKVGQRLTAAELDRVRRAAARAVPARSRSACSTLTPTLRANGGSRARSRRSVCRFRCPIASSPSTASSSASRPRWSMRMWRRGCPRTSAGSSAICGRRGCA